MNNKEAKVKGPLSRGTVKRLRMLFAFTLALCWGHLALMCLQDYDRPGVSLPAHTWFMLLSVLSIATAIGLSFRRAIFGALLGALLGIIFPPVMLHSYDAGYVYWEQRPESERQRQEIAGPTLTGENFDIKNCRAKLLLVDYWATWCKPCVAGIPHVLETWDKYHSQGLDIVGVSLDQNKEHLADFVQLHELPYPQIFFGDDGKSSFDNPLATKYGVAAIPQLVLIEPQSQLVLTNVANGKDLQWKVKGALDALNKVPLATLDVANKRLAMVSLLPYIFGVAGGLIGSIVELLVWRRMVGQARPNLKRVK